MATTGAQLEVPHIVNTSGATVGQGSAPEVWVLYSTDDASVSVPTWTDATAKLRDFSTSRGRQSELAEIDAGTTTITLDNRARTFDPAFNAAIRPMNQWKILEQFSGETQPIFTGYADSYDQTWPNGMDAEAVVQLTDEFKVLNLDALAVTDPPRDSYEDVVMFDEPSAYWPLDTPDVVESAKPKVGPTYLPAGTNTFEVSSPIVGSRGGFLRHTGSAIPSGYYGATSTAASGSTGAEIWYLAEFAGELWFRSAANPGTSRIILDALNQDGASYTWEIRLLSTGVIRAQAQNSALTVHSVDSAVLPLNTWHHIVATNYAGSLRLYVNGVEVASTAWTGAFGTLSTEDTAQFGQMGAETIDLSQIAMYQHGLTTARVAAHYTAGAARGYAEQRSDIRIGAVLDSITSHAPRSLRTGARNVLPVYQNGQSPLEEIRGAKSAEAVDAVCFTAKDGTLTFLDTAHRSVSPWNTVQATFDDEGTAGTLPYTDIDVDYSESFLMNEWNVTRDGGLLQTARDTTSIAKYFKRSQSLNGMPMVSDANALTVAQALLAKYKEPLQRILNLTLDTSIPDVTEAVMRLDIGSRIRIFRTPPGGGARIDQTLWIQKISVAGANDGAPWTITLGVSPV
jgi:hypothetical protein